MNSSGPTLCVFIPAYNAEKSLSGVIERIPEDAWQMIQALYVINDGSEDDTAAVAQSWHDRDSRVRLVSFEQNKGYGTTVRKGLELCRRENTDYSVCLHADGQYPPEKLAEFVRYMERYGVDVLQGSRHKDGTALKGGMPYYKFAAGKFLTALENAVLGLSMTDFHSGYIFYSRRAINEIPFERLSRYFEFDLEVIACARRRSMKIDELGIPTHYADEKSYLNPVVYGFRVLFVLFKSLRGVYSA